MQKVVARPRLLIDTCSGSLLSSLVGHRVEKFDRMNVPEFSMVGQEGQKTRAADSGSFEEGFR
jgi:hypothetical protein